MMTTTTRKTLTAAQMTTLCGHEVLIAHRDPGNDRLLNIEWLVNGDGFFGTVTAHGPIYKPTWRDLERHLLSVYDVDRIHVVRTTLVA